jgi:Ca-activated chloride channel family protein
MRLIPLGMVSLVLLAQEMPRTFTIQRGQKVCVVAVRGGYIIACGESARPAVIPWWGGAELFPGIGEPFPGGVPDDELKLSIVHEFQKRNYFKVVSFPEDADLVFLAGVFSSAVVQLVNPRGSPPGHVFVGGDEKPNVLDSIVAVAVPSGAYLRYFSDSSSVLKAAAWTGSVGRTRDSPAKVEDLVKRFHSGYKSAGGGLCAIPPPPRARTPREIQSPSPTPAGVDTGPPPPSRSGNPAGATIKVDVSLVSVPVVVTGADGKRISGLRETDFLLLEDDVEQRIDRILPEEEPFHVALVMDSSASMHSVLGEMRRMAGHFIESLRPEDRVMAVSFGRQVLVQCEWATDRDRLRQAILDMRISDTSRVYDALSLTLKERLDWIAGRKALVFLTDGVDVGSGLAGAVDTLASFAVSSTPVYAIHFDTKQANTRKLPSGWDVRLIPEGYLEKDAAYAGASQFLQELSDVSGGRLEKASDIVSLQEAFAVIARDLREQYTICYYPSNQARDGSLRRLRVEVDRPGANVRARAEYRAAKK